MIQIVREINDEKKAIVNRLHQMQVVHKWWILNCAKDHKKTRFELRKNIRNMHKNEQNEQNEQSVNLLTN